MWHSRRVSPARSCAVASGAASREKPLFLQRSISRTPSRSVRPLRANQHRRAREPAQPWRPRLPASDQQRIESGRLAEHRWPPRPARRAHRWCSSANSKPFHCSVFLPVFRVADALATGRLVLPLSAPYRRRQEPRLRHRSTRENRGDAAASEVLRELT